MLCLCLLTLPSLVSAQPPTEPEAVPLTLSQAEQLLLENNRDLSLARLEVAAGQAGIRQAEARPNPTLSWSGQQYSRSVGLGSGGLTNKQIDQAVAYTDTWERGGKRRLRIAEATARYNSTSAEADDAVRQNLRDLRFAYYDLMLAEYREQSLSEMVRDTEQLIQIARRRVKAGDMAGADLARLQVEAARTSSQLIDAQTERRHAQVELATLIAREPSAHRLRTDGEWPNIPATEVTRATAQTRSDVRSAEHALIAAQRELDLARAQRRRDIEWSVQVERDPANGPPATTFGVSVSIPLHIGNNYSADIRHADVAVEFAEQRLQQATALAATEAQQSQADLQSARAKLERFENGPDALLPSARRAVQSADFAFARGAIGLLDLLDARRTWIELQLEGIETHNQLARALSARDAALELPAH